MVWVHLKCIYPYICLRVDQGLRVGTNPLDMPGEVVLQPSGNSGNSGNGGNGMADIPEEVVLHPSGNRGNSGRYG